MRKKLIWIGAALVLIAIPALIGLVALRGDDDSSSSARRAAALVPAGLKSGAGYQLVIPGVTPSGQAIEVHSFSWGVKNASGTTYSGGTTAGKAQFNDIVFTKQIDQTSAMLAQACANGKHYPSAVLTLLKSSPNGPVEYAKYTLTDVLIGAVEHSGSASEVPMESISLNYVSIKSDLSTVDNSGTKTGTGLFSWNIATNTAQ